MLSIVDLPNDNFIYVGYYDAWDFQTHELLYSFTDNSSIKMISRTLYMLWRFMRYGDGFATLIWSRTVTRRAEQMNCATVLVPERGKDSG